MSIRVAVRKTLLVCAATVVIAVVAIAAAVSFRVALVETVVRRVLVAKGFPEAEAGAVEVGLRRIVLAPLRLGAGLAAERVEVGYDLHRLPRSPLVRLRLEGVVVDLAAPGSAAWRPGDGAAEGGPVVPAWFPETEVADATVRIGEPYGPLEVRGTARLDTAADGSTRIGSDGVIDTTGGAARFLLDLRADGERLSGSVRFDEVTVDRPGVRIQDASAYVDFEVEDGFPGGTARVAAASARFGETEARNVTASLPFDLGRDGETVVIGLEGADIAVGDPPVTASGVVGRVEIAENVVVGIREGRIEDREVPPRVTPLSLSGRVEIREDAVTVRGAVSAAAGGARATVSGEHDRKRSQGFGRVELAPIVFDPQALRPGDLVPALSFLERVSGTLSAEIRLGWDGKEGPATKVTLRPKALSFTAGGARFESLSGDVALRSLFPLVTSPDQELRARRIRLGVDLEEVFLRYALEEGEGAAPVIRIARGEARFSGGRLLLEDERFDPGAAVNTLRLRLAEVDLDRLTDTLGADGFEATGAVSGVMPLRFSAEGVTVAEGALKGTGPGVVRVSVATARRVLGGGEEALDLLLQALENFHYDELSVGIEKKAEGASTIRIHLDGKNPELLEGRPFRIRVNVSADLDEILAPVLEASRLTGRTLREILHGLR